MNIYEYIARELYQLLEDVEVVSGIAEDSDYHKLILEITAKRDNFMIMVDDKITINPNIHKGEEVECDLCGVSWMAVYPYGTKELYCPNCDNKVNVENLEDHESE